MWSARGWHFLCPQARLPGVSPRPCQCPKTSAIRPAAPRGRQHDAPPAPLACTARPVGNLFPERKRHVACREKARCLQGNGMLPTGKRHVACREKTRCLQGKDAPPRKGEGAREKPLAVGKEQRSGLSGDRRGTGLSPGEGLRAHAVSPASNALQRERLVEEAVGGGSLLQEEADVPVVLERHGAVGRRVKHHLHARTPL